ncbi:cell wall metabolism sensor histidine kinase WalK [Neobacillus mesonae]|uniref:sensor histidine kinase n=1 Tax=Neobacillus mesonae TaxID=1193713 RepID=UPI00203B5158|nr:HAMP domain-containing sensor histidine kinase [Neobacillus mesonae]MCM3569232.1 HAMP domain-containing histidine kinase [Neobacillus mesonae]
MSIKKRLFFSNAVMIIMPIIVIIFIIFLLNIVFFNGFGSNKGGFNQNWQRIDGALTEFYNELQKTASLDPDKFYNDKYLNSLRERLNEKKVEVIIRKDNELLFTSAQQMSIMKNDLPDFGYKGYYPAGSWVGDGHYSTIQYDFYFNDSSKGSIFLLESSASFVNFARSFFPVLFIGLILVFVLTNVLLSTLVSRSILRPVRLLSDAAEKIRSGNLNFRIKSKGRDELGKLVNSFDSMREQLKESLELRDKYEHNRKEMIANISHDLKTPITSILGYVEGIQDGVAGSAQKQKEYLATIHSKALYVNRLIEELSLYSKLDVKKLPFHFESVDIYAFIQDYLNDINDELSEKDIQVVFDTEEDRHVKVCIDRDKVVRVVENIIFNSVKYMNRGFGRITIFITEQEKKVKVSISDNGPGVSEDEVSTIFNRFYRTDPSRSTAGSGLGLAIASQIIKAHDGEIWAENLSSGGLCVHFTLKKTKG